MTDRYHRRIDKSDSGTSSESLEIEEEHQLKEDTPLQLYKAIIGYRMGKIGFQCPFDIEKVIMLEITEGPEMEQEHNGHDLTLG